RGPDYSKFMELARQVTLDGEPALNHQAVREKIAEWYVQTEGLKHTRMRAATALSRGQTPGPENSIGKIIAANVAQDTGRQAMELLDQYGIIGDPELLPMHGVFHAQLMGSPGGRIAGGTDEILKNIIAERVLGLPGDIRLDKEVAFKDIPTGR